MTQEKLASLYGNNIMKTNTGSFRSMLNSKSNGSEDCVIVEKSSLFSNLPKGHNVSKFVKVEEEERGYTNSSGMKRAHVDISSPTNWISKSPSATENVNNDVSANGFVTAKAKLVLILHRNPFSQFLIVTLFGFGVLFLFFFPPLFSMFIFYLMAYFCVHMKLDNLFCYIGQD